MDFKKPSKNAIKSNLNIHILLNHNQHKQRDNLSKPRLVYYHKANQCNQLYSIDKKGKKNSYIVILVNVEKLFEKTKHQKILNKVVKEENLLKFIKCFFLILEAKLGCPLSPFLVRII